MADPKLAGGLNSLLKKDAGVNEYFLSLPSVAREKLRDFYELAETFVKEES